MVVAGGVPKPRSRARSSAALHTVASSRDPTLSPGASLRCAGVLLFQLSSDTEPVSEDTRVMEIFISGDACISIYTHLCPSDNTRPMALDLLWQVGTSCDLGEGRRRRLGEAPCRDNVQLSQ